MNKAIFHFGAAALVMSGIVAGTANIDGIAVAGDRDEARASKQAAELYRKADKALARRDGDKAVKFAEAAVALQPQDAAYRALLGQAYLGAGRFTSAQTALGDALKLDPTLGKAALSLALAQIGTGDWATARATLDANAATIPAGDRGLAVALAGDPQTAVQILMQAARGPDSNAKIRQNLALAMALAGNWQEAKVVASGDLAPSELDARMAQWAQFAHPASASDQVATLLGVTPIEDGGQPVALALNGASALVQLASQAVVPVDKFMPGQQGAAAPEAPAPVEAVAAAPEAVAVPDAAPYVDPAATPRPQMASVSFGAPSEVAQRVPASYKLVRASEKRIAAARVATATATPTAKGNFYVQLGAFHNAAVARDAWKRIARAHAGVAAQTPSGMAFRSFYRLSVGGFSRTEANAMCASLRSSGSRCFVRAGAGDRVASWYKPSQLAMR